MCRTKPVTQKLGALCDAGPLDQVGGEFKIRFTHSHADDRGYRWTFSSVCHDGT